MDTLSDGLSVRVCRLEARRAHDGRRLSLRGLFEAQLHVVADHGRRVLLRQLAELLHDYHADVLVQHLHDGAQVSVAQLDGARADGAQLVGAHAVYVVQRAVQQPHEGQAVRGLSAPRAQARLEDLVQPTNESAQISTGTVMDMIGTYAVDERGVRAALRIEKPKRVQRAELLGLHCQLVNKPEEGRS